MAELVREARLVLQAIHARVPHVSTPEGLYRAMADGFLPVPYLWECRDEFDKAVRWQTRLVRGAMKVVDENGAPLSVEERLRRMTWLAPPPPP